MSLDSLVERQFPADATESGTDPIGYMQCQRLGKRRAGWEATHTFRATNTIDWACVAVHPSRCCKQMGHNHDLFDSETVSSLSHTTSLG
jgi:hypothetical protein